jgi:hypothetical protein
MTHSTSKWVTIDNAGGQLEDPPIEIPEWKHVVLIVWAFYRNGVKFRESVHAWHSVPMSYNAASYFYFNGSVTVKTTNPDGSTSVSVEIPANYVSNILTGPSQDNVSGTGFNYCIWTPPPRIVDDEVKGVPGTYTYDVNVAVLTGSTYLNSSRTQGWITYNPGDQGNPGKLQVVELR